MTRPASPHPRGWTHDALHRTAPPGGFPAPAGMDPRSRRGRRRTSRLPRTRGDGPGAPRVMDDDAQASPHPRGWTRTGRCRPRPKPGFPAPAGMDPTRDSSRLTDWRLPRTRGDGPVVDVPGAGLIVASPHPRGWTPRRRRDARRPDGFPAPAGMDPYRCGRRAASARLPRTRGDGPPGYRIVLTIGTASPHPRGWTGEGVSCRRVASGFPAPAGMDPWRTSGCSTSGGLPRTRGDGPPWAWGDVSVFEASPHPRGWTRRRAGDRVGPAGFPAPAGMDPAARHSPPRCARLPRTRGDGPSLLFGVPQVAPASPHPRGWTRDGAGPAHHRGGFPAPAGMDPSVEAQRRSASGLPRTRGDGPCCPTRFPAARQASPHPRGWTRAEMSTDPSRCGFPAPAGMDPDHATREFHRLRLPRTRGDGPVGECRGEDALTASPHPRGWTRRS